MNNGSSLSKNDQVDPQAVGVVDAAELGQAVREKRQSLRDRTIGELLLSTGCRRSDVAGLDVQDVDLAKRTITISNKGGKTRQVRFSEGCAVLLRKYLYDRWGDSEALFLNRSGNRLSDTGVYRATGWLGLEAGPSRQIYPHRLRHTFDTNLSQMGDEPDVVFRMPICANVDTTRIYARIPNPDLVAMYRKLY